MAKKVYPIWRDFQTIWNAAESVAEVASATGQTVAAAQVFASRMRRNGWDMKRMPRQASLRQRLLESGSVTKTGGCWLWTGATFPNGYGQIRLPGGDVTGTHRASWIVHFGEIPKGMQICHKCDTKNCINPAHLFLGTCLDNLRDMVEKGRQGKNRGEQCWQARLTVADVLEIRSRRKSGEKLAQIAVDFGISISAVSSICHYKSWKSVA